MKLDTKGYDMIHYLVNEFFFTVSCSRCQYKHDTPGLKSTPFFHKGLLINVI